MKKRIFVSLLLFCACLIFGCNEINPDKPEDVQYSTDNPVSSLEFHLFLNKQIAVYTNQITMVMFQCKNGSYVKEQSEEIILILNDTLDSVKTVNPPVGGDDEKSAVIKVMEDSLLHVKSCYEDMADKKDVSKYIEDFESDFTMLTGLSNLYYQ